MSQSYMKRGHCKEQSDEAISYNKHIEIAALPSVVRNDNGKRKKIQQKKVKK